MTTLILLTVKASIFLIEFSLGLKADVHDATYLLRRPGQLFRSLLSMYVIMPSFALLLAISFHFSPALEVALIALALSPVPPMLPKKVLKAGGGPSYIISLLVSAAVFSIVFIPSVLELLGKAFGVQARISLSAVALFVLTNALLPIGAGIAARNFAPDFADRITEPLSSIATLLLIAGIAPVLFTAWPAIISLIGNGTIIAIVAFTCMGIASGELLGGQAARDRTVLALSTASRHPGIAIAITRTSPHEPKLVLAAVLLYLIVSAIVTIPYVLWSRQRTPE